MKIIFALLFILAVPMSGYAQMPFVMKPGVWTQYHNTPDASLVAGPTLTANPDGSLSEMIPPCVLNMRPNYLVANLGGKDIRAYKSVTFTVGVTVLAGTPKFVYWSPTNGCLGAGCNPVSVKVMIWGPSSDVSNTTNRWWAWLNAADMVVLAPGKFTVTVPLDGSHFGGVLGGSGMNKAGVVNPNFAASKASVYAMGLAFGGGWYAGHGTCVNNGKASFQLYSYTLN